MSACGTPAITEMSMTDPRIEKLADVLINYSCAVKPGEKMLIEAIDMPHAFTKALVRACCRRRRAAARAAQEQRGQPRPA